MAVAAIGFAYYCEVIAAADVAAAGCVFSLESRFVSSSESDQFLPLPLPLPEKWLLSWALLLIVIVTPPAAVAVYGAKCCPLPALIDTGALPLLS